MGTSETVMDRILVRIDNIWVFMRLTICRLDKFNIPSSYGKNRRLAISFFFFYVACDVLCSTWWCFQLFSTTIINFDFSYDTEKVQPVSDGLQIQWWLLISLFTKMSYLIYFINLVVVNDKMIIIVLVLIVRYFTSVQFQVYIYCIVNRICIVSIVIKVLLFYWIVVITIAFIIIVSF